MLLFKILLRKGIADIFIPGKRVICFCIKHRRVWNEGDLFSDGACKECIKNYFEGTK